MGPGSLSDHAALAQLVSGTDAVIHIAGLTNTPDPAKFEAANVDGTAAVISAAKAAKSKAACLRVFTIGARAETVALWRVQSRGGRTGYGQRAGLDHRAPARRLWPARQ